MVDVAGGQAVIEGVMMRKGTKVATAVRLPNGKITIKKQKVKIRKSFWKIPFLRGVIALWDMLFIGMGSLIWSSNQQLDDHEKISKKEIFFTVMFVAKLVMLIETLLFNSSNFTFLTHFTGLLITTLLLLITSFIGFVMVMLNTFEFVVSKESSAVKNK